MAASSSSYRQLTPSSALSPESTSVHTPESDSDDGYEMQPLSRGLGADGGHSGRRRGSIDDDDERAGLVSGSDGEEDEEEGGEVIYDNFEGREDSPGFTRWPPRGRRKRREFLYTKEQERRVVRKFDWNLVGALAGLYMLSFLDRSNIGNAKIAGMMEDLKLSGGQYEWLLTAFYITYITFEWMTLLWKVFPAHKYIACCVAVWGIVASIQALAVNWWSMMILRALLGIAEAAFGPGVPFYLSFFYRREELALRAGIVVSAAPLATAYSGFLAYAITSIPSPIASWRLLFILEGFPSMIAAVAAYYWIPDSPTDSWFLTSEEKKIARRRLLVVEEDRDDVDVESEQQGEGIKWSDVKKALGDSGNWITALMFFACNIAFSSLPVFLPTIINDMGYTSIHAQALSAPPYLSAFVLVLITTYLSDKFLTRWSFVLTLSLIGATGYSILALTGLLSTSLTNALNGVERISSSTSASPTFWNHITPSSTTTIHIRYLSTFLAAAGVFSSIAIIIAWNLNNSQTASSRGAGMAILGFIGQCGPLLGTRLYPKEDGPYYVRGMAVCAVALVGVAAGALLLRWRLGRKNRRGDIAVRQGGERVGWRYIL